MKPALIVLLSILILTRAKAESISCDVDYIHGVHNCTVVGEDDE